MAREMAAIRRQVQADLLAAGMDINKTQFFTPDYWSKLSAVIETMMRDKLQDVYVAAAEQFMDATSYAMADDVLRASARAWANQASQHLVTQMNETSRRQVTDAVDKFFSQSMNNRELRNNLERIFSPRRAELAAITEVTRAAAEGAERVANELRQHGVRLVAVWETLVDERVCPICGPRHGTKQGDGWMFLPPAHPKCRCFVNYEVVDIAAAAKSLDALYIGMIISIKVA
jgi:hypothetical protein